MEVLYYKIPLQEENTVVRIANYVEEKESDKTFLKIKKCYLTMFIGRFLHEYVLYIYLQVFVDICHDISQKAEESIGTIDNRQNFKYSEIPFVAFRKKLYRPDGPLALGEKVTDYDKRYGNGDPMLNFSELSKDQFYKIFSRVSNFAKSFVDSEKEKIKEEK